MEGCASNERGERTLRIVGHGAEGIHPDPPGPRDHLHGLHLSFDDADPLRIWNPLRREVRPPGHLRSGWDADLPPVHRAIRTVAVLYDPAIRAQLQRTGKRHEARRD